MDQHINVTFRMNGAEAMTSNPNADGGATQGIGSDLWVCHGALETKYQLRCGKPRHLAG